MDKDNFDNMMKMKSITNIVDMKEERNSFSDAIEIEKLLKRNNTNIKKYFGALKDSEVLDEIEKCLEARKSVKFGV